MQTLIIDTRSMGSRPTAVMVADVDVDLMGSWLGTVYHQITDLLEASGNHPIGPPFARYRSLGRRRFRVEAGFPIARPIQTEGDVRGSSLPGGTVAVITHIGHYDDMEVTYDALETWLDSRGATAVGDPWEVYFSGPEDPEETWRTDIFQPYRTD